MPPIFVRPPYPGPPQFYTYDGAVPPDAQGVIPNVGADAAAWAAEFNDGRRHPADYYWTPPSQVAPSSLGGVATRGVEVVRVGDLEPGQVVATADLVDAGPDVYEGVVVAAVSQNPQASWRAGIACKITAGPTGARYVSSELAWDAPWTGVPSPFPRRGNVIILYVPPREATHMPNHPPSDGRPHCPLCYRYASHVVAGMRHRTTPSGQVWCPGSDVGSAMSAMLSTTNCPHCDGVCWTSSVGKYTTVDGTITACRTCRDTLTRLYTHGAAPEDLRFGVELETESLAYEDEGAALAKGRTLDHHRSGKGKVPAAIRDGWEAKGDGSLRGPVHRRRGTHKNAEVISPPMYFTPESLAEVQVMARELRYKGARHAERCGLHVHVDCTALGAEHVKSLMEWWYAAQQTVLLALPPWDYRRRFCVATASSTMAEQRYPAYTTKDSLAQIRGNERYNAINLNSLRKHGTVEFRFFNGSVHAAKVTAYIEFCVRLVSHASRNLAKGRQPDTFTRDRAGMTKLLDLLGFEPGRTSQRWHLLGALATEADRPGPQPALADLRSATPVAPVEQFPDEDYDFENDEDEDEPPF